jgi:hypothetical protein
MKKIALAVAFSVAASSAFAGGMAAPVLEPVVIVEETSSSAGGIIVPILAWISNSSGQALNGCQIMLFLKSKAGILSCRLLIFCVGPSLITPRGAFHESGSLGMLP